MDEKQARIRLIELQQRLSNRSERIDKHLQRRDEPLPADIDDRATELEGREVLEELDDGTQVELRQVEHALARLDAGLWNCCETCGKSIGAARLRVLPFATRCIACAGRDQRLV